MLCKRIHALHNLHIVFLFRIILTPQHFIGFASMTGSIPGVSGQMPASQRAVRNQRNIVLFANRNQFSLILPIQQIVVILHCGKHGKIVLLCNHLHIVELKSVHCRCADCTNLSGFYKLVQRLLSKCSVFEKHIIPGSKITKIQSEEGFTPLFGLDILTSKNPQSL